MARTSKPAAKPKPAPKKKKPPQSKAKQTRPAPSVIEGDVLLPVPAKKKAAVAYTSALANEIIERIAGGESLNAICKSKHMPHERSVRRWRDDDIDGFADRFATAVDSCIELWAGQVVSIADEDAPDQAAVQRNRLRVDARKWILAKLKPERFGEKVSLDVNNKIAEVSNEHLEKKLTMQLKAIPPAAIASLLGMEMHAAMHNDPEKSGDGAQEERQPLRLTRSNGRY